jgi:Spy/CpxP family protein refolding chaperone
MMEFKIVLAALGIASAAIVIGPTHAASPYAGQQERAIKTLSEDEVADLLAGRGLGMARAGELNHYPGPMHVLELRDQLALTPQQVAAVQASFERMSAAAKPLGAELVDRERDLDRAFASGAIDQDRLAASTAAIAELQGRLRAVHLVAHLETRAVLTADQIARYDALRGYGEANSPPAHTGHQHR